MFAIGHLALGYLTGKGSSRVTKTRLNLPLLLAISVLPDVDLVLQAVNQTLFMHRGPVHSIITLTVCMVPFLVVYRKQAIPYYLALLSHPIFGDLPTGGIEMLWPLTQHWFGGSIIPMASLADVAAETVLFAAATAFMFKNRDLRELFNLKSGGIFLLVSFFAVLGPAIEIGQGSGAGLPWLLLPESIFWLLVLAYALVRNLRHYYQGAKLTSSG